VIEAIVVGLLVIAAIAFVTQPMKEGPLRDDVTTSQAVEEAGERKRAALVAILDMEEEKAVGKLSDGDFKVLRSQYEAEAIAALKELDAVRIENSDAELEEEILRIKESMVCGSCGAIKPEGSRCPACDAS
jgi:rubrerythrin